MITERICSEIRNLILTFKVRFLALLRSDRKRLFLSGIAVAAFLAIALGFAFCLPRDLFEGTSYSTVVESREGELLGARTAEDGQWRFPPSGDVSATSAARMAGSADNTAPKGGSTAVSPRYAAALVQFEDRHFYVHNGVSIPSIARAIVQNARSGRVVSGGSTITMQTIRISRPEAPRNFGEKVLEAVLALRLELRYSKDEILALYAAHAPFGGNVVGVEAASWRYFGRSSDDLSWAEAATLAVLPNSPSLIHPGRNRLALKAKRDRLLDRLYNIGLIDAETHQLSLDEPLPAAPYPLPQTAYHLVERCRAEHPGQRVRTGVDISLQKRLEQVVDRWNGELSRSGVRDLSAVVIDVQTGEIIAYCGNALGERQNKKRSAAGRALPNGEESDSSTTTWREGALVDIATSPRSTGSILKPFLYAALLQRGDILPHTLVPDIPISLSGFTPHNFDLHFSGAVPASEALSRSLNVPYVNLLRQYGVQNFYDLLQRAGMTSLLRSADDYGLSLILGGAEGRLLDMVRMYGGMSAFYQGITSWLPKDWPLTDKCSLYYVFDSLKELNRPDEMDWRMVQSLRKVAWKTGTSFGFRDAWAVGTTTRYAVGVWAGNANGEASPSLVGARTAGPVLFDIFNLLPQSAWFEEPDYGEYVWAEVCTKSGCLAGQFCSERDSLIVPPAALRSHSCPYHRPVLLSADGKYRLSAPEKGSYTRNFFILPPAQEWYYRKVHPEYEPLPPLKTGKLLDSSTPMAFIYPEPWAEVLIPDSTDGGEGEMVFRLAHINPETEVFWHLDSEYVGSTSYFHTFSLRPAKGRHTMTVVDANGNSLAVTFTVLN